MATNTKIVLASTSKYRKLLMDRLALPYVTASPKYDEPKLDLEPVKLAEMHAIKKAESLAKDFPDALIIGSDQLVSLGGEILGKPHTEENAVNQLLKMQGRCHQLITAVAIHQPQTKRTQIRMDIHTMCLRKLDKAAIKKYIKADMPLNCAGSYKLESLGIALFKSVSGEDDTAVIGLPLLKVVELLSLFGVDPLG